MTQKTADEQIRTECLQQATALLAGNTQSHEIVLTAAKKYYNWVRESSMPVAKNESVPTSPIA